MGVAAEEASLEFIAVVSNFFTASSIDKKESLYNSAMAMLPTLDLEYLLSGTFPTFESYYNLSQKMKEDLEDTVAVNNSKLFLAVISYIAAYDTEDEWINNYDYVDTYITIARGIIREGNYDPYYGNIEEYLPLYEEINAYFYRGLQAKHIDYIGGELAKYDASEIYFERYGIIAKLDQYMTEAEIDPDNEVLKEYRARIENAYLELEAEKDEYEALLKENTAIFIKRAEALSGSIGYTEMKKVCEELAVYIHMMDVSAPEARDAIAIYGQRCEEIRRAEEYASAFISRVLLIDGAADTLEAIVDASQYIDAVDTAVEGVSEAIAAYERACTEYDSTISQYSGEMLLASLGAAYISNTAGAESLTTLAVNEIKK